MPNIVFRYPPDWSDKNKEDKNPEIVENLGKLNLKDKSERGEKSGLPETGPPPFVPGEKWTGNVEKPDLLDPSKNPDLTPATMEQIMRNRANRVSSKLIENFRVLLIFI